jgi:hypothetical protein
LLGISLAFADDKPVRIAVLDTGFGPAHFEANLCKFGHKDFTGVNRFSNVYNTSMPVPIDQHGHGTDMVELIERQLIGVPKNEYCIVIIKYYSVDNVNPNINFANEFYSLNYVINLTPDILSISGGGTSYDLRESRIVKTILDNGTKIVASAGNESRLLSHLYIPGIKTMQYYPAMYDPRIVVVGSKDVNGKISEFSNYGNIVSHYEVGEVVTGRMGYGGGTSQATAVRAGKLAKEMIQQRKNERLNKINAESVRGKGFGSGSKDQNL